MTGIKSIPGYRESLLLDQWKSVGIPLDLARPLVLPASTTGKTAVLPGYLLGNHLATPVVTALPARRMGQLGHTTARAVGRMHRLKLVSGEPPTTARAGYFLVWYCAHDSFLFIVCLPGRPTPPGLPIWGLLPGRYTGIPARSSCRRIRDRAQGSGLGRAASSAGPQ